jgi:hypothetical protein
MAKDLVKRQHYVPRTYLKNFAGKQQGDEYYIKALPIEDPREEKIFELNIKNVCLERNLYTLPGETDQEKMLLEKFYSDEIEQHYNFIYALLTDPAKTTVTPEERERIISTVVTTFYRTTKWINQHNDLMKRIYTQMFALCQQHEKDHLLFEGIEISVKGKTVEELLQEHKVENRPGQVITQLEVAFKLIEVRVQSDNIFVSKLTDDGAELITSDNPVVVQNIKGGPIAPFDPSNIMKLPLDKKHMLFLMPDADEEARKLIVRHNVTGLSCQTEKLISNAEQFQKADRFILGDDNSLKGYLKTKELAERPLSEEELKNMTSFEDYIRKAKDLGIL